MRVKMKSSQSIHQAAGETDADFDTLDKNKNACQEILQNALAEAIKVADKDLLN